MKNRIGLFGVLAAFFVISTGPAHGEVKVTITSGMDFEALPFSMKSLERVGASDIGDCDSYVINKPALNIKNDPLDDRFCDQKKYVLGNTGLVRVPVRCRKFFGPELNASIPVVALATCPAKACKEGASACVKAQLTHQKREEVRRAWDSARPSVSGPSERNSAPSGAGSAR
jgi:hypothetical protein